MNNGTQYSIKFVIQDNQVFDLDVNAGSIQNPLVLGVEGVPPSEVNFDGDQYVDGSDLPTFAANFGRTDCP